MGVEKDKERGTYTVRVRYKDFNGENRVHKKRGFKLKREAKEYETEFLRKLGSTTNMDFASFVDIYKRDVWPMIKRSTQKNRECVIETKILPFFSGVKVQDIKPRHIIQWQNELLARRDEDGKGYSPVYLKKIRSNLNAIFNHAERFYDLKDNPIKKVKCMGKEKGKEIEFWTLEEYMAFREVMKEKPEAFYAFEVLYWTGIRLGDADGKISLNQQKPSKHAGLRRFGPEKFLQRNNEFMKERPIYYKKPIKTEKDFSTWLRCFYYTTKAVITEYTYF